MTSDYNQNLWNSVLAELEKRIPKNLFELWFKETQVVSYSPEVIKIKVANDIIEKKVSDKYLEEIGESIFKCCGDSPKIEFVFDPPGDEQDTFNFEESIFQDWQDNKLPVATATAIVKSEPKSFPKPMPFNETYRFENFVVGPSNQLAHASALAVANKPGKAYNPLFLHGGVGLGKTHLLQAICHAILQRDSSYTLVYLSCEEFINEFISSVERGDVEGFRHRFRYVDMLLIDDVHFLGSKERTQEEFFHTFNTLYNAQKQIILSCDSAPSEIPSLKERLVSRFKWGLVTQLDIPTFETRVAIIKKKSRLKGVEFSDEVCQYIAENLVSNVRELEGAINHLVAVSDLHDREISLDLAKRNLREVIQLYEPEVQVSDILNIVAEHFNVKLSELQSKKRSQSVVRPRQVSMYLAKKLTKHSLQEIGGFFGGKDHTTVIHAIEKIKDARSQKKDFHELLVELEHKILGDKKA